LLGRLPLVGLSETTNGMTKSVVQYPNEIRPL
jgi:hypothetical protein